MLKFKKSILLFACLLLTATYSYAQSLKEAAEQQKRQQQQAIEQRAKAAKHAEQERIEREAAEKRAEQERIKREERKRLGIPDIVKADLDDYAVDYKDKDTKEIILLDVYSYYSLRHTYDTELKRKVFEQSADYSEKLENLKERRKNLLLTVFRTKHDQMGNYNVLGKYDLEKQAFIFSVEPHSYVAFYNKDYTMKVDEQTALKIENNRDVYVYIYFTLNGKIDTRDRKCIDKMRVVVANQKTGEIYFDDSEPADCLPLAKQERMSTEELKNYAAEHKMWKQRQLDGLWAYITFDTDKIVDVQNALPIYVLNLVSTNISILTTKLNTTRDRTTAPSIISDTPNRHGKAVEFVQGSQHRFTIEGSNPKFNSNRDYTVSFWIKDFSSGVIFQGVDNNTFFPVFSCNKKSYLQLHTNPGKIYEEESGIKFGNALELMSDQWHFMTMVCANNTCYLYVDSKLMGKAVYASANFTHNIDKWQFGGKSLKYGDISASMKLDNIRIYSRALSAEEVFAIYEEEKQ